MTDSVREKILIAVDGSEHALHAVRYAASLLDPERFDIVLFHVATRVPESFIDLEKIPAYNYRIVSVDAWEQQQETIIREFMSQAESVLAREGFSREAVSAVIRERIVGIARDVAAEAANGYRAVVVGRKGMSGFKDFMMGGTAHKILELSRIPVWVVGDPATPKKIMVCLDNSEGSMNALKHLSAVIDRAKRCEIVLFHAVRAFSGFRKFIHDVFGPESDHPAVETIEEELRAATAALKPSFETARSELIRAGADPSLISTKVIPGASNSANIIIEEAEKEGFDTIVVGRRGLSRVEEFLMGRVSNKVINLAGKMTVWVVS